MNGILFIAVFFTGVLSASAQQIDKIINAAEVERIEKTLSADDMQGRKPFTPGIEKAADFISGEFKKAGLQFLPGLDSYRQTFSMVSAKFISAEGSVNGATVSQDNIIAITTEASLKINERSAFKIAILDTGNLMKEAGKILREEKNYIVFIRSTLAENFSKLKRFKRESFKKDYSVIFVSSDAVATTYSFDIKHEIKAPTLFNIVGCIPGKTKKEEYVVFSGHYDHLGIGKPDAAADSIYNGANDDAAGTTAVIMLANYFSQLNNNERTLIFVSFTAEESGGYGSQYFSQRIDADKTVAMFNIEMIGTQSKWGTNSAYITGYERSDFGKILQANLTGSNFHFEPDPYPTQKLFYRSDNATLAALGVPAHTISTSKMDSEKFYHTLDDEIGTLDMNNMAEIIKAIAISSTTIISGKATPVRIEKAGM